jgi:mono/diheme cytochrome c family protein
VTTRLGVRGWWLVAVVGLAGSAAVAAQAPAPLKNPVAVTPESIAAGKTLYTRTCAPCHGTSGEGGPGNDLIPAAPDLTDAMWDHGSTDGDIFNNVRNGIGPEFNMTPFKDRLSDDDIWNVVNYVRSLAKKSASARLHAAQIVEGDRIVGHVRDRRIDAAAE